jgi:hypothetical protein
LTVSQYISLAQPCHFALADFTHTVMRGVDTMKETIVELKIKGYHVAIDNESTIITKDDETLLKVEHKHIKAMIEFITQKINQIKKQIETKE